MEKILWMVQYNLAGLQQPYRMKLYEELSTKKTNQYYDKSENVGGDPIPVTNKEWPLVFAVPDRVAYYFNDKKAAFDFFKALNSYRGHIVRHL